jgi:hypothetical protein
MPLAAFWIALQITKRQPIAKPPIANKTVICQVGISVLTPLQSNMTAARCVSIYYFGLFACFEIVLFQGPARKVLRSGRDQAHSE